MDRQRRHIKIADRVITRLKLKQLRLLVAISRHSSLLRAAEEMSISQPAASKLLKDLEEDFDVRLFERTNRGVVATEFGRVLIRHGQLVLTQIGHAAQELDDLNEGTGGRVMVGTLLAASASLLPRAIARLRQERPNVTVTVREGANDLLMPALRIGELDLVLGRLPQSQQQAEIAQETLLAERVCIFARPEHPLSMRARVQWHELIEYDWILPPPGTTLRGQIDQAVRERQLPPLRNTVESISFLTNRALLVSTDMLGAFPFHVAEREIAMGELKVIPCELSFSSGDIGVSYRQEAALSPAAIAFLGILRATAKTLGQELGPD